jgi:hypothetical protein
VNNIQNHWVSGLCPQFGIPNNQKNTTFKKPDLFPFSGESEGDTSSVGSF